MMQIIEWNPSDRHPENDAEYAVEPLWLPPWKWCKLYGGASLTSTLKMKQNGLDSLIVVFYSGTPSLTATLKMKQSSLDFPSLQYYTVEPLLWPPP